MVESLVKKLSPRLVICIDALAARASSRIGAAIQLTDAGIQPGGGVGNHRKPLNRETLGVDVVAVGMPTVIYAATLARDAFALLSEENSNDSELDAIERELLGDPAGEMIVTQMCIRDRLSTIDGIHPAVDTSADRSTSADSPPISAPRARRTHQMCIRDSIYIGQPILSYKSSSRFVP